MAGPCPQRDPSIARHCSLHGFGQRRHLGLHFLTLLFAAVALVLVSLFEGLLRLVPFRRLMWFVGLRPHVGGSTAPANVAAADPWTSRVAWAVDASARRTPWETKCFARALTGSVLLALRGRPREIVFGVRPAKDSPGDQMTAHAWLRSNGVIVTGAAGHEQFTPVAVYRPRPRNARRTASR